MSSVSHRNMRNISVHNTFPLLSETSFVTLHPGFHSLKHLDRHSRSIHCSSAKRWKCTRVLSILRTEGTANLPRNSSIAQKNSTSTGLEKHGERTEFFQNSSVPWKFYWQRVKGPFPRTIRARAASRMGPWRFLVFIPNRF